MDAMKQAALLLFACASLCSAQSSTSATELGTSRVFNVTDGATRTTPTGDKSRDILRAVLLSGEAVSIHESTHLAGGKPAPLHVVDHSEFVLIREGNVTFFHDGISEAAGPGAILYVANGTNHAVRNTGETPATYVVIAIGGDAKR